MSQTQKFPTMDGLRGVAALFVVARHTHAYWLNLPFRSYLAVDLFFLLSGFVIAHSYEQKLASGQMSTRHFLVTRLIRLYPLYLLSLFLALAISASPLTWSTVVRGVFMVPSLYEGSLFPLDVVYWSLFFELVVNALYVFARPVLTNTLLAFVVGFFGLLLVYLARLSGGNYLGFEGLPIHLLGGIVRSVFGILFGILLYRHRHRIGGWALHFGGGLGALIVVCFVLCSPGVGRFDWLVDSVVVLAVFPIAILCSQGRPPARWIPLLTVLGAASYPLYLFHPLLGKVGLLVFPYFIPTYVPISGLVFMVTTFIVSLGLDRVDSAIRRRLVNLVSPLRRLSRLTTI